MEAVRHVTHTIQKNVQILQKKKVGACWDIPGGADIKRSLNEKFDDHDSVCN